MVVATKPIITLDDFVGAVFALYDRKYIPSRYAVLQRFFFDLANDESVPPRIAKILSSDYFQLGDLFPYSREVESSIVRLQIDGTLSAMNPDYERLAMDPEEQAEIIARVECYDRASRTFIRRSAAKLSGLASELGF